MRTRLLLPALCLLGATACVDPQILTPETAPAADAHAAATDVEESGLGPVVELENCIRIEIVQVENGD